MKQIFQITTVAGCLLVATSAHAQAPQYQGVWHQGQVAGFTSGLLSRDAFLESGQGLAESGLRLVDVETSILNGRRVYAGHWTTGTGSNLFSGPLRPLRMRQLRATRRDDGLRLVDFEIFRTPSGARRYLGVWRNGTGREVLTRPLREAQFLARGAELTGEGLRLIDVEIERINGRTLYSGLFRSGSGSNFITTPETGVAFRARRDEMVADGLELVDLERVRIDGQLLFAGVWSSGNGESRISRQRGFGPFLVFSQQQFNEDKHLADFELIPQVPPANPTPTPPGPGPGGTPAASTADLPPLPPWIQLTSDQAVTVDFIGPFPDPGFLISLPRQMVVNALPENGNGDLLIPDNLCGLRLIGASEVIWENAANEIVEDNVYNHISSFNGSVEGQNLEPFALGGIDFTGPIGACAAANEPWQFFFPMTKTGAGGPPPLRRLTVEMPGGGVEFLNFNFHPGEALDPGELFSDDVFDDLVAIMESFADTGDDNGYCSSVSFYMEEVCDQSPGLCPVASAEHLPAC